MRAEHCNSNDRGHLAFVISLSLPVDARACACLQTHKVSQHAWTASIAVCFMSPNTCLRTDYVKRYAQGSQSPVGSPPAESPAAASCDMPAAATAKVGTCSASPAPQDRHQLPDLGGDDSGEWDDDGDEMLGMLSDSDEDA